MLISLAERSMTHLLDNIVWRALSGSQAKFSAGNSEARRYALGFSPIVGFANQTEANFAALAAFASLANIFTVMAGPVLLPKAGTSTLRRRCSK